MDMGMLMVVITIAYASLGPIYLVLGFPVAILSTIKTFIIRDKPIAYPLKKFFLLPALLAHGWNEHLNAQVLGTLVAVFEFAMVLLFSGTIFIKHIDIVPNDLFALMYMLLLFFCIPFFLDIDIEKYAAKKDD